MPRGWPDDSRRRQPASLFKRISTASTNGVNIKGSPGVIVGYFLSNQNAAVRYIKLYDKASSPTVGTDTPVATLAIPALASAHVSLEYPLQFDAGIGIGMTTGAPDANTGAVAVDEVIANIWYI